MGQPAEATQAEPATVSHPCYAVGMLGFDWDDANRDHIARHEVSVDEFEEAFNTDTLELAAYVVGGEQRYEDLGVTDSGRILFLVTTVRGDLIRPITAFDATRIQKFRFLAFQRSLHE
jgi:uncharacterized DUF497 family protein